MNQPIVPTSARVVVLRVFTDGAGAHGNHLGIVDGSLVEPDDRQRVARALGYSETVFIDDPETGELRIFTPAAELPLAGHPLVGAAWHLERSGAQQSATARATTPKWPGNGARTLELRPPGGLVRSWSDDHARTWIEAPLATLPDWTLVELARPSDVDGLRGPTQPDHDHAVYWSWIDRSEGRLRARAFAPLFGIAEDEATGSAALRLVERLGRPIEIRQGRGSVLFGRPVDDERAAVGGLVAKDASVPLP